MKIKQSDNRCIFCQNKGLTKQHVWPNWLRNVIPRIEDTQFRGTMKASFRGSVVYINPERKLMQGHTGTKKLRIVCLNCNGGWMSRLEQESKIILTDLINDENVIVDPTHQETIARWSIMTAMVAEFTDLPTVSIPYTNRNNFMNGEIPDSFKVWIGRFEKNNVRQDYHHTGMQLAPLNFKELSLPKNNIFSAFNTQFSYFIMGSLFIVLTSTLINDLTSKFEIRNMDDKLFQIYPIKNTSRKFCSLEVINDTDVQAIRNYFTYDVVPINEIT